MLRGDLRGRIDWRRQLRDFVGRLRVRRPSLDRPSRRCPELLGVVAGSRRVASRSVVACVIDTSGSVTDEWLELIDAEVRRMARLHRVHVVESDCEVKRVTRSAARLRHVTGRGGTDFRPPLDDRFLRRLGADAVVVFTDGDGPAPDRPPRCPVVWCLVPGGEPPAAYGLVVRMDGAG